jgi:hypothetical protein
MALHSSSGARWCPLVIVALEPFHLSYLDPFDVNGQLKLGRLQTGSLGSALRRRGAECSARHELQRNTIHAITEASRLGPIVENVSEVASAAVTMNLGADQEKEAAVLRCFDCPLDRSPEAWPTRFAIELGAGGEQRQVAPSTYIGARSVFLIERACPGTLGVVPAEHRGLFTGKLTPPFLV